LSTNYTYVDSALSVLGRTTKVPAEGLSRNSYNVTGIYEKGPVSFHVSYNWRSEFVLTTSGDPAGRPLKVAPLKSLDMSFNYAVNDHVSIKLDAVNVLFAFQDQYFGTPQMPQISNQLDRTFQAGIHVSF
jgi:outer membrane receptor protein involved in Fe transport